MSIPARPFVEEVRAAHEAPPREEKSMSATAAAIIVPAIARQTRP